MRKAIWLLVLAGGVGGCIEYEPTTQIPPPGKANPRPLQPKSQTDKLVQVEEPEVDILWVVDNSCSMVEEQSGIAENNPIFMDFFMGSGLDYHIGVVSTDMFDSRHRGRLRESQGVRWVDDETPSPSDVFATMIQLGSSGSADERGREAAYAALEIEREGYNAGFLRDDAALHVVVLSDENDHSTSISIDEFVEYLLNLKWNDDMVTFSSIVSPQPVCPIASEAGDAYTRITNAVGGISWSICDQDADNPNHNGGWPAVLEQLGIQASGLKREYFLSQLPVDGTIEVWVENNGVTFTFEQDTDWIYIEERNSVVFNEYVPGALAEVYVEYEVLSAAERDDEE